MAARILVADDNEALAELLEIVLIERGYDVVIAHDGDDLLQKVQVQIPDLMIVDLLMPRMNGYEAIRQIRNDTRLSHIPIIVLTALDATQDLVTVFDLGADDYIVKPFQMPELLARVKSQLARATRRPVQNPLTGLPGNVLIEEEINHRLRINEIFALLYIDLDNFKSFNDAYGFARGDTVIQLVAQLLQTLKKELNDESVFIGHIGGDDFAVIMRSELVTEFCETLINRFDQQVLSLYDEQSISPHGRAVAIQSLSIGVVSTKNESLRSYNAISRMAAEMKHVAKRQRGSVFVVDRRSRNQDVPHDRRKRPLTVAVLGVTGELKQQVVNVLTQQAMTIMDRDTAEHISVPEIVVTVNVNETMLRDIRERWSQSPILNITSDLDNPATTRFTLEIALKPNIPLNDYLMVALHLMRLEAR